MIPTAESVVIGGPLTLVPLVRRNLCGREGEQILRRPRAAHQGERRLHLVVFRQAAAHLGRATEHVARRFIAELVGDQGACPAATLSGTPAPRARRRRSTSATISSPTAKVGSLT